MGEVWGRDGAREREREAKKRRGEEEETQGGYKAKGLEECAPACELGLKTLPLHHSIPSIIGRIYIINMELKRCSAPKGFAATTPHSNSQPTLPTGGGAHLSISAKA